MAVVGVSAGCMILFAAALLAQDGKAKLTPLSKPSNRAAGNGVSFKRVQISSHPQQPALPVASPKVVESPVFVVALSSSWERTYDLRADTTIEISVHLDRPSTLPDNGRVGVEWTLAGDAGPVKPPSDNPQALYTRPTANWRKTLSALDGDVYLIYRAPQSGRYTLKLKPIVDEIPIGEQGTRWREKGGAPRLSALPGHTPWPAGLAAPVSILVRPVNVGNAREQEAQHTIVECEPNDTPEQAQPISVTAGDDIRTWEITGGADDVEFFDNGLAGHSGDDWFRIDYKGNVSSLLTAQLGLLGQSVAAQIRCYHWTTKPGAPPLLEEFIDGRSANERIHQQDEPHRTNISRLMKPGESYLLRVEANAPGYQLQLRTVPPGPYTDPKMAIRQGMYQQIGQVDAWLTNRPRGASVERRIRDSGNLLGTQCMSCHTQSGVWGPAVPIALGYRLENSLSYRHMIDVMYECLRPTNVLKDAANNTSLAPLDIGDGPAGTRAAGYNIVNAERILKPSRLHSKQQIRTANYVLQTSDPGGINAAGPGSNVGQAIVLLFAAEILKTAWESSDDPKYFRALEDRARRMLDVKPVYTDDVAVRLDFFGRLFRVKRYLAESQRASDRERTLGLPNKADPAAIDTFITRVEKQVAEDEARLRAIQNADGSWGFGPGASADGGKTWKPGDSASDPSPTALAITALTSIGRTKDDPAVAKAVKALLAMQDVAGRWNKAAQTGFVTSAYSLHALARLYRATPTIVNRADYVSKPGESLPATIRRVQAMALAGDPKNFDLLIGAARHASPLVRYWAMVGLGTCHSALGVPAITSVLSDRVKMVRDAATWAFRQSLLDDNGWEKAYAILDHGGDDARAQVAQALGMRADAVMPKSTVDWTRLAALFDRAMNRDPHPAVRAWAGRAAWQWWVWNPPIRTGVNAAWLTMLTRPEPNATVEAANRYSSQALFIANGHKANGSRDQQYKELATLFTAVTATLDSPGDEPTKSRLAARLVAIGGTFYQTSGADGGPGQMGYVTPGSGEMMGKAALAYLAKTTPSADLAAIRAGIEGASNVPYQELTSYLVNYSLQGPEQLRQVAASAVSDPRSVSLAAVPELVQPQMVQIKRGAMEPARRGQLSDPIMDLWSKVNWNLPKTEEQQRAFFDLMIPRFDHYLSASDIAAIADPARLANVAREMDAAWYLADRLGDVLRSNPDLHQEIVLLHYFPARAANPLEERYWVQNVEWMLTYDGTPGGGTQAAGLQENRDGADATRPRRKKKAAPIGAGANLSTSPSNWGTELVFASGGRRVPLGCEGRVPFGFAGSFIGPARLPALGSVPVMYSNRPSSERLRLVSDDTQPPAAKPAAPTQPDPVASAKDRALQLYLDQLKPEADPKTRGLAIRMANQTALRSNPEVLRALEAALPHETDKELRTIIENALKQSAGKFIPELVLALKAEHDPNIQFDLAGEPVLTPAQQEDIVYFRDYVMPELNRQKRTDQQACMGCHGLPGRVPSLSLRSPDKYGYSSVTDLLSNYRALQKRVLLTDIEKSKLLRKPLNIQDGKEDGHQGGRRYSPTDPGYLIIRHWVENQAVVQKLPEPPQKEPTASEPGKSVGAPPD